MRIARRVDILGFVVLAAATACLAPAGACLAAAGACLAPAGAEAGAIRSLAYAGGLDGSNKLVRSYVWGPGPGGVGGLLECRHHDPDDGSITARYQPYYDDNGNVQGYINAATHGVVASFDYTPYGQLRAVDGSGVTLSAPTAVSPFMFSTKYFDSEIGLYYYGYRYYDPSSGKWLNRDPLAEEGGLNLYGFCRNDPVNGIDSLGLDYYENTRSKTEYAEIDGKACVRLTYERRLWEWGLFSGNTAKGVVGTDSIVLRYFGPRTITDWDNHMASSANIDGLMGECERRTANLRMIPGGATAYNITQGDYGWAAVNFVGDVGLTLVGGQALKGAGTAVKTGVKEFGKATVKGVAEYVGKQAAFSAGETGVEWGVASLSGDKNFSVGASFAKNLAVNAASGGAGAKGKLGQYATGLALRTAGDTAYGVAVNGSDWRETAYLNAGANMGSDAIVGGVLAVGKKALGRLAPSGTPVIGRLPDTAAYAGKEGFEIMEQKGWNPNANAAWIQGHINAGSTFTLASPITEANILSKGNLSGFTVYADEISQILNSGYVWKGGVLVRP